MRYFLRLFFIICLLFGFEQNWLGEFLPHCIVVDCYLFTPSFPRILQNSFRFYPADSLITQNGQQILVRTVHKSYIDDARDDTDSMDIKFTRETLQKESLEYLKEQFQYLSQGKNTIDFDILCSWEEIQHLFDEEIISKKDLKKIYLQYAPDLFSSEVTEGINFDQFLNINNDIDNLIEFEDELDSKDRFETTKSDHKKDLLQQFQQQLPLEFPSSTTSEERLPLSQNNPILSDLDGIDTSNLFFKADSLEDNELTDEDYDEIMERIITNKNFHNEELLRDNHETAGASADKLPLSNTPTLLEVEENQEDYEEYQDDYDDDSDEAVKRMAMDWMNLRGSKNRKSRIIESSRLLHQGQERSEESKKSIDEVESMYSDSIEAEEGRSSKELPLEEPTEEIENELSGKDINDINAWDHQIRAEDLFQKEFLKYLIEFFQRQTKDHPHSLISFQKFIQWDDIQGLMEENHLEITTMKNVWIEATEYERFRFGYEKLLSNHTTAAITQRKEDSISPSSPKSISSRPDDGFELFPNRTFFNDPEHLLLHSPSEYPIPKKNQQTLLLIHLDTFIRLNYRLEQIIEDMQEVYDRMICNEQTRPWLTAFKNLTAHHQPYDNPAFNLHLDPVITFEELLEWDFIQQCLAKKEIELEAIKDIYSEIPTDKQFLRVSPLPVTGGDSPKKKSFLPPEFQNWPKLSKQMELKEIVGLNRDKFLFFCTRLVERIEAIKATEQERLQMSSSSPLPSSLLSMDSSETPVGPDNDSILE